MCGKLELKPKINSEIYSEIPKFLNFQNIDISEQVDFTVDFLENIDGISFQAIVDKENNIVKYEVLLKGENIEETINTIKNENKTFQLFNFVFEKVCKQIQLNDKITNKSFSINAFPEDISHKDFVEEIEKKLRKYSIEPKQITIEILETELYNDIQFNFFTNLKKLKKMGIILAIDDFGDNCSNGTRLGQLQEYISILKIDGKYLKSILKTIENNNTPQDKRKKILEYNNFLKKQNQKGIQIIFEHIDTEKAEKLNTYFGQINYLIQGYDFGKKEENI